MTTAKFAGRGAVTTRIARQILAGDEMARPKLDTNAKARCRRVVGLGTVAGAVVAAAMSLLAAAPIAPIVDLTSDPILDPFMGAGAAVADAAAAAGSATDLTDISKGAISTASDPLAGFDASSLVSTFGKAFYQPLLTAGENWINNPANAPLLHAIPTRVS